jgi:DNA repair exonuclease SbcCD nuclease subunit
VLNNATAFIAYRMGKTFVLVHHSDKCKPDQLVKVMSVDFQHDWGETDYHYVDIGHIHHKLTSKEHPGAVVESWNILAPMDKWAHDGGYRSRQSITVVDRSRRYGEVGSRTLPIRRVRDAILAALPPGEKVYQAQPKKAFAV